MRCEETHIIILGRLLRRTQKGTTFAYIWGFGFFNVLSTLRVAQHLRNFGLNKMSESIRNAWMLITEES